ncbi:MAG: class Ib ribonucleoside-diphosphate reductase assembly flavoprotein NrdI [Erysipelotrichaceae bacterium]|nr:class Ib ribonucleoside-diphosphate reductase assembly flavoprotein NrdI [Erysipelotrichaceae bacterium]
MKYVYASRTGNVKSVINRLGLHKTAIQLDDGSEIVDEDYILLTYTDGYGDVPYVVEEFLKHNGDHIKGVIVSGDMEYDMAYCRAGDTIAYDYNCPLLYKFENEGTDTDLERISELLGL